MRIFHRILKIDGMIVFFTILDAIRITSHIFPSSFILITSVVRVKMFHISKITCRKYSGASPWRTVRGIAVVRLKIHHPVCDAIQQKVHEVGKRNFAREVCKENEVKMIKIAFLQKKSLEETSSNTMLMY